MIDFVKIRRLQLLEKHNFITRFLLIKNAICSFRSAVILRYLIDILTEIDNYPSPLNLPNHYC